MVSFKELWSYRYPWFPNFSIHASLPKFITQQNESQQQTLRPQTILAALRHINETGKPSWEVCVFWFHCKGTLYVDENSIGFSKPCFLFHHLWMFDELIQEHFNGTSLEVIEASYMDLYGISIYMHICMQFTSNQYWHTFSTCEVCPMWKWVWGERKLHQRQTTASWLSLIYFFFQLLFFSLLFIQSNLTKKRCSRRIGVFFSVFVFLSFRCFRGQLPRCCNNPFQPSPVHAGGVLSRLLSTCEFHRGNGRVEMCCGGVVASLDLMVVTNWVLTKGRRKGHKAFKIFTFWSVRQILSLKFRIELESRHSFFQRLQQSDGVATAWAKSWSIFFWSQSMTAKLHRKVIGVTSPRNKVL